MLLQAIWTTTTVYLVNGDLLLLLTSRRFDCLIP